MLNLSKIKKVYFIGIGGIMMSALVKYFLAQGKEISGSDRQKSEITDELHKMGVNINFNHKAANILPAFDLIVYTQAINKDNPELLKAKQLNLPIYSIYQLLGFLSKDKFTITVSGMHGKSTTTAMLGLIMEAAGLHPTVFVGTKVKEWAGNLRLPDTAHGKRASSKPDYLLSEACEYKDSFLNYYPDIALITNIEAEHLDYFHNLDRIMKSFSRLTGQIKKRGWLLANMDSPKAREIFKQFKGNKISFALDNEADFRAVNIALGSQASRFSLVCGKKFKAYNGQNFSFQLPGRFNVYNVLAAIAAAALLSIKPQEVKRVLKSFHGVWRRFEFKGKIKGIEYYDDYAHHPTEIKATILAASQKFKHKKWWLIYQPHLYSRTHDLLNDFVASLNLAENLILVPTYAAREENKWGIESDKLVKLINKKYSRLKPALFIEKAAEVKNYLAKQLKAGDVVMTMGAGDVKKYIFTKFLK